MRSDTHLTDKTYCTERVFTIHNKTQQELFFTHSNFNRAFFCFHNNVLIMIYLWTDHGCSHVVMYLNSENGQHGINIELPNIFTRGAKFALKRARIAILRKNVLNIELFKNVTSDQNTSHTSYITLSQNHNTHSALCLTLYANRP